MNPLTPFVQQSPVARLETMAETGCSEDLTFLDALGEVKSVERIKSAFRIWFKKQAKTTKRKHRTSVKPKK
jgi:hypothetical protein